MCLKIHENMFKRQSEGAGHWPHLRQAAIKITNDCNGLLLSE